MKTQGSRIAILGAGRGQVGLYRAAQRLGMHPIAVTMPGTNLPALQYTSDVIHADISNPDSVLKALQDVQIDGVATSCLDTGLQALGRVADHFQLPGITEQAAILCSDKLQMKEAFVQHGVSTARFFEAANHDDVTTALGSLNLPVIVKAADLQGSAGIVIARSAEEVTAGFDLALGASKKDSVIIEEFIEGYEFGAQALVVDGEIKFTLLHDDETFMRQTAIPVGHSVPLQQSSAFNESAIRETQKAIRALGLDNCAVNVDLIMKDEKPYLIELTGRVGANGLPEMVSTYFDIDYYETVLRVALGEPVTQPWSNQSTAFPQVGTRMLFDPDAHGTIQDIQVDQNLAPESAEFIFFRKPGDQIAGFESSNDCLGQVVVSSSDNEDIFALLDQAVGAVCITTQ